jgi:CubicO group peptidase (beta-lactamase class C family)
MVANERTTWCWVQSLNIEKISNQSYVDYLQEHIFDPAGMSHAGFYELDLELPDRATSITRATGLFMGPPYSGLPRIRST